MLVTFPDEYVRYYNNTPSLNKTTLYLANWRNILILIFLMNYPKIIDMFKYKTTNIIDERVSQMPQCTYVKCSHLWLPCVVFAIAVHSITDKLAVWPNTPPTAPHIDHSMAPIEHVGRMAHRKYINTHLRAIQSTELENTQFPTTSSRRDAISIQSVNAFNRP